MAIQIEYSYGGYTLPTAYLKARIGRTYAYDLLKTLPEYAAAIDV